MLRAARDARPNRKRVASPESEDDEPSSGEGDREVARPQFKRDSCQRRQGQAARAPPKRAMRVDGASARTGQEGRHDRP